MASLVSEKIYKKLKKDIASGMLGSSKIPPEPELSHKYNVSIGTLRKAVGFLVRENILESQQGRGTFIKNPEKTNNSVTSFNISYTPAENYTWGHLNDLRLQEEIDRCITGQAGMDSGRISFRRFLYNLSELASPHELPDIVQVSTYQLQLPGSTNFFAPVPKEIRAMLQDRFSSELLEEYTSCEGELFAIPIIVNPTVAYIHLPSFEKAGISPDSAEEWTWEDFMEISGRLKNSIQKGFPVALIPAAACLYEFMLKQFGGDYFDERGEVWLPEKAFKRMMEILVSLHQENLCVNLYKIPQSYGTYLSEKGAGITFLGPRLGEVLAHKKDEWAYMPLPRGDRKLSTATSSALCVSAASRDTNQTWNFLADMLFNKGGFERLAMLPGVFPAENEAAKNWKGTFRNHEVFRNSLSCVEFLPSRKGFSRWRKEIYDVFTLAMEAKISIEEGRMKAIEILNQKQIRPSERNCC